MALVICVTAAAYGPRADAQTAPATTVPQSATARRDLAIEFIDLLELNKDIDRAVDSSGFFFKTVPKDADPAVQAKINALFARAQTDFEKQKGIRKLQVTSELKSALQKQFSDEELKYLITLAKYPITKKLRAFMNQYPDIIGKPYTDMKLQVEKLKAQVEDLKQTSKASH